MSDLILSILMLAGIALAAGAVIMFRRNDRKKAGLMLLASLIMFGNVALWLVPNERGISPANPERTDRALTPSPG
jgi:hypothetical protein